MKSVKNVDDKAAQEADKNEDWGNFSELNNTGELVDEGSEDDYSNDFERMDDHLDLIGDNEPFKMAQDD